MLQLLVTLRNLSTGRMHLLLFDSVGLSTSTVGRIVRRRELADRFIKFPTGQVALIVNQSAEGPAVGTYLKDQNYHFVLFRGQIIQ
jgi:hypothetical protein